MSTVWNTSALRGVTDATAGFELDLDGMRLEAAAVERLLTAEPGPKQHNPPPALCERAHQGMRDIENGAVKNPDEHRRVTHFTDRIAYPESALFRRVEAFAENVRQRCESGRGQPVEAVIVNGIGGSALGPQLLQFACHGPAWNERSPQERRFYPRLYFLDNTDSAGLADALAVVRPQTTMVVTISKSGGTQETRNNLVALQQAYAAVGEPFARHAVAITQRGSKLDRQAQAERWLARFPMAESIGGRTSETSIVGHLPAALTGIPFRELLAGACHMDALTREPDPRRNPAYQLAIAWYLAGHGRGDRNMVVVPYADRLVLLSRYLQQLVMESLGKARDLDGRLVFQGLNVFGNKGGTDAHAYIQQLNDGRDDFFVTFIEILRDPLQADVDDGLTMGDYLHAFRQGLANALTAKGRQVINLTLEELTPFSLGLIIALYERAVAYYAELIGINAFHQPGVEAYKKASGAVNALNRKAQAWIAGVSRSWSGTANAAAEALGEPAAATELAGILAKFAVNRRTFNGRAIQRQWQDDAWMFTVKRA
ncbi:MAG: glucose-6-phosphate isomerase [Lentisphaerae bacterium]|nr:glucose-6-phosphate isomerase [Lentisphaerota bacterium]